MSDRIPSSPTPGFLDSFASERRVSAEHLKRWINEINHSMGYNTQPIASATFQRHTVSPADLRFRYKRNPGCSVLMFLLEPWDTTTAGSLFTVSLACSGTIGFIYPGEPGTPSPLHGAPGTSVRRRPRWPTRRFIPNWSPWRRSRSTRPTT
jgi:hypothetical protein